MSTIITIIIFLMIVKSMKRDAMFSDFGKILGAIFLVSFIFRALGGAISLISILATLCAAIAAVAIPLGVILFLIYKYVIKQDTDKNTEKYGWTDETKAKMKEREKAEREEKKERQRLEKEAQKRSADAAASANLLKSKILPKPVVKRTKIISNFNDKYQLNLTEEQIKRIADASYLSYAWKQEVESMVTKYDAVYQWFQGDTAYLRVYLHVFPVQDVTSDFTQQEQICIDSFEEVFAYADSFVGLNVDERIKRINSKFFTSFDEVTYMIAYRFLEAHGYHHKMDKVELNRNDDDIDDLLKKYEKKDSEGTVAGNGGH